MFFLDSSASFFACSNASACVFRLFLTAINDNLTTAINNAITKQLMNMEMLIKNKMDKLPVVCDNARNGSDTPGARPANLLGQEKRRNKRKEQRVSNGNVVVRRGCLIPCWISYLTTKTNPYLTTVNIAGPIESQLRKPFPGLPTCWHI